MDNGTFGASGGEPAAWQTASLWGLIKSAAQEDPAHMLQLLTVQLQGPESWQSAATALFHAEEGSNEFGAANVGGAVRTPLLVLSAMRQEVPFDFYLDCRPKGSLKNLTPVPVSNEQRRDSLYVRSHAVGLNFRDVLNILVRM